MKIDSREIILDKEGRIILGILSAQKLIVSSPLKKKVIKEYEAALMDKYLFFAHSPRSVLSYKCWLEDRLGKKKKWYCHKFDEALTHLLLEVVHVLAGKDIVVNIARSDWELQGIALDSVNP